MAYCTAYAFFYSAASAADINAAMPQLREEAETPSDLELQLIENMDSIEGPEDLKFFAFDAREQGMRYALLAYVPGKSAEKAADELNILLERAYNSPVFKAGKTSPATIVTEDNGIVKVASDFF